MRLPVIATVLNSKNKIFDVLGVLWDDGVFFLENPRPDRYPEYAGLMGDSTTRELHWAEDRKNPVPGDLSKFIVRSLILNPKPPKRRKQKSR